MHLIKSMGLVKTRTGLRIWAKMHRCRPSCACVKYQILLSFDTVYSIQWFCNRTAKVLIRLRIRAVWAGPSLSAHALKARFCKGRLTHYRLKGGWVMNGGRIWHHVKACVKVINVDETGTKQICRILFSNLHIYNHILSPFSVLYSVIHVLFDRKLQGVKLSRASNGILKIVLRKSKLKQDCWRKWNKP